MKLKQTSLIIALLCIAGCEQASEPTSATAPKQQNTFNKEEQIAKAASFLNATPAEVTPEGNWSLVDKNYLQYYEIKPSIQQPDSDFLKVRTKTDNSLNDNKSVFIGLIYIDCQARTLLSTWVVEFDKESGEFLTFIGPNESDTDPSTWKPPENEQAVPLYNKVCNK